MEQSKLSFRYYFICAVVLFVITVLDLLLFSYSTSPLFDAPSSRDSGMFLTIGKYWSEGYLPYIDLWDSKGPIIFFVNALGYSITHSRLGVFIIQVLCLFIANLYHFKILLLQFKPKNAFIWTLLILLSLNYIYEAGDTVEEFILPLLSASFYYLYKWSLTMNSRSSHPPRYAFLYGAVLSFALFSRLTNAVGICMAVFFITVLLSARKQWGNLLLNIGLFLSGFILVAFPFVCYFLANNALGDMWYAMFTYNLEYAGGSGFNILGFRGVVVILTLFINCWMLVVVSLMNLRYPQFRLRSCLWLSISTITFLWLLKSNGYGHYAIIALPCMAVAVGETKATFALNRNNVKLAYCLSSLYIIVIIVRNIWWIYLIFHLGYTNNKSAMMIKELLNKELPQGYVKSFVAYEPDNLDLYLHLDTKPYYRFFVLQNWAAKCGRSLRPQIERTFRDGNCKYIFVNQEEKSQLQEVVGKRYHVRYEDNNYCILEINSI